MRMAWWKWSSRRLLDALVKGMKSMGAPGADS